MQSQGRRHTCISACFRVSRRPPDWHVFLLLLRVHIRVGTELRNVFPVYARPEQDLGRISHFHFSHRRYRAFYRLRAHSLNHSLFIYLEPHLQGDHSPGKPGKVWEFQSGQGKVREVKSDAFFFKLLNTPKLVLRPGLCPGPRWGSLQRSPRPPSRLGRWTPHPIPQLLQPQLLNNWLSGLTLFLINMKRRLLTISVNTR